MSLDKLKKTFVQACVNHGTIDIEKAKVLFQKLCEAYDVQENVKGDLKETIKEIDDELRPFQQSLSIIEHPINNTEYVVFALLSDNKGCKYQPQYTDTERKYFCKLLEALISNEHFYVHWDDIYKIVDTLPSNAKHLLSKQRAQDLSILWMSQGYLLESDNLIYLGPRTIIEYGQYLRNTFPEFVNACTLCKKVLFWNVRCAECSIKFHRNCIRKYLTKRSTCPSCKNTWNTPLM